MIDLLNRLKKSIAHDDKKDKSKKRVYKVSSVVKGVVMDILESGEEKSIEYIASMTTYTDDYISKAAYGLFKEDKVIRRKNPERLSTFIYKIKEM